MYKFLDDLPRNVKSWILLINDHVILIVSFLIALMLRVNDIWPSYWISASIPLLILLLVNGVILTMALKLYSIKIGTFENTALLRTLCWVALLTIFGTIGNIIFQLGAPRTVPVIFGSVMFLLILTSRISMISLIVWLRDRSNGRIPIAIYGAGSGGLQMLAALNNSREFRPTVFIDDNPTLKGTIIGGLKVITPEGLKPYIAKRLVNKIFLAIPSLSPKMKRSIVNRLQQFDCEVLELPSYIEMVKTGGILDSVRPVSADELLGRDNITLNVPDIKRAYTDANILVSGAGGSIGSELCRKILAVQPKHLVIVDASEFNLYTIEKELVPVAEKLNIKLTTVLGSIASGAKINSILVEHQIDVVLHAAAYKHVPMVEDNVLAGVENNVLGTSVLAEAAIEAKVKRFILVSTDKAVRPTNIMGATKRLAELVLQDLHSRNSGTIFSSVRFGNVLGSSGSVIPLFKEQIANGGPVTVTHPEVTRYFMTIPEAASLVLLAGSYSEGGEVFVLDMGKPIKIINLARRMIELSGRTILDAENPDGEIELITTGLRPGEKLYEELLIGENTLPTPHPKILRAKEKYLTEKEMRKVLKQLKLGVENLDIDAIRATLHKCVEGYKKPSIE